MTDGPTPPDDGRLMIGLDGLPSALPRVHGARNIVAMLLEARRRRGILVLDPDTVPGIIVLMWTALGYVPTTVSDALEDDLRAAVLHLADKAAEYPAFAFLEPERMCLLYADLLTIGLDTSGWLDSMMWDRPDPTKTNQNGRDTR